MSNLAENLDLEALSRARPTKVLILDDCEFDRKRIKRFVSKINGPVHVTEAEDISMLSYNLQSAAFDIILVDYALTDGDGLQAVEEIRDSELNKSALAVMVTGNDSSSLAVNALKLGFDDYLTKDNMSLDLLSSLIQRTRDEPAKAKVVPFPYQDIAEVLNAERAQVSPVTTEALADMLEPALRSAMDVALSRVRAEELGEHLVSLIASLQEPDEFQFFDMPPH